MKFSRPIFLCAALVLTACSSQSGMTTSPVVPFAGRSITPQSASAVTSNLIVPISFAEFIPCANGGAGETVTLSGNLHELTSTTITANNIHLMFTDNPQGISGVGSVTGDKYQATGVTRQDENIANAGFPANLSYVDNFRIVGQGPGNNFLVHEVENITIAANGTVTVARDNLSISCK